MRMQIIKSDGTLVEDSWTFIPDAEPVPASGDVCVSLDRYVAEVDALKGRAGRIGVRLRSDQEAKLAAPYLAALQLIAIDFPTFKDGRGYSTARLLRERFGYEGELRAVGDVLRDQLFYMRRCGFDSYALKAGKDLQGAPAAFHELSVTYQGAVDDPRPLFRRRAAASR
jgi:uncharacterized protein (DUF934 family)